MVTISIVCISVRVEVETVNITERPLHSQSTTKEEGMLIAKEVVS